MPMVCKSVQYADGIDVINVFLFRSRFLRFLTVFLIFFSTFFVFKKRCQMQSMNM